jgi:hypothetical protein
MEVPHVLVVNKADVGIAARKTLSELRATLQPPSHAEDWWVPALAASATTGTGIEALADSLEAHRIWLVAHGLLAPVRQRFQAEWIIKRLLEEFGHFGIEMLGGQPRLLSSLVEAEGPPFEQYDTLRHRILGRWRDLGVNIGEQSSSENSRFTGYSTDHSLGKTCRAYTQVGVTGGCSRHVCHCTFQQLLKEGHANDKGTI